MTGKPLISCLLLWVLVVLSAIAVIYSNHLCRNLYAELSRLEQQKNALQVEWGRYLLEQSTWASLGRVEKIASSELKMHIPASGEIVMVAP